MGRWKRLEMMMPEYDYIVVGCGMFGTVFAQQMAECAKKVLVIEKRSHIAGNCYTDCIEGIDVHKYGPHIFHTNDQSVWAYVNRFAEFNNFVNRPKVNYKGKLYSFPINLMTLYQLFGVKTPAEAKDKLREVATPHDSPENLEEYILSEVGQEVYEVFIKGYTTKQWGQSPKNLPTSIIKRLPIRLTFDDNYYRDRYQGIPLGGYTKMFKRMLDGVEVILDTDYFAKRDHWNSIAGTLVFTGRIDEYFDFEFGELEYRSLKFKNQVLQGDYQGNAVINYTDKDVPYTRIIEHKHFDFRPQSKTVITWEFPAHYDRDAIPYYPVNTQRNNSTYYKYRKKAEDDSNIILGGRLATYRYLDMDGAVLSALTTVKNLLERG